VTETTVAPAAKAYKSRSQLADFFTRLVKKKPLGLAGGIIVLLLLLVAVIGPLIAPFPWDEIHTVDKLTSPNSQYLLGTDNIGRDLLSRIIRGARISIYVGLGASALNVLIATSIGMFSGYFGGKLDIIVQRFVDALLTFPMLIIVITLMNLIGTGITQVIIVLGIWGGIGWIRVVRSAVISIRQNVYIEAARAIGCSTSKMVTRHILPNITPVMIVIFSVAMSGNILGEASLSFLGFGIPPPEPSWGGMLSGEGRQYMYEAPWLAVWPGVALSIAVYGINMWGDAVRDLLDPRLRGGVGRYGSIGGKRIKGDKGKKQQNATEVAQ